MLDYDFEQSIGFWMIGAAHAYQKAVTGEISPQGITFRQAQVLGFLALEQALSQKLFRDDDFLESYGFLRNPINKSNPDGFPVGFANGRAADGIFRARS